MTNATLLSALVALAVAFVAALDEQAAPGEVAGQQPPAQPPQSQTGGRGAAGSADSGRIRVRGLARDAQTPATPATSSITGRVLSADTGKPVKRAQVRVSGTGRGGRSTITDDQGIYTVTALGAGSYTVIASKNGFVDAIYGQRRPLQAGAPLELADNQQAANVDPRLIRGGVITGHVLDEDGEPLVRAVVTIQRYQYLQGTRQLTSAGGDQTDDRGMYRVFGLPAGDYYVSVNVAGLGQFLGRGLQQLAAGIGGFGGPGGRGGRGGFGAPDESEPSGYAPTYYPGVVSANEAGKIPLGPGQEVGGIDFQIQLVAFATVGGIVGGADGSGGITVTLAPQDTNARGRSAARS